MQLEPKYTASVTLTGPDGGTIALALLPFFRGDPGPAGAAGEGVPIGGTAGQVLAKIDETDYNTTWVDQSGGITAWGSITGVLSDQTDLQTALNGKAATGHTHTLAQITDFNAGDYATAAQGILADTAVQDGDTLAGGFTATIDPDGTITTGTYTPSLSSGSNYKSITNGGAFTLAPPALATGQATTLSLFITNNVSAGAITTTGFNAVTGDAFSTVNGDDFLCRIEVFDIGGTEYSLLNVVALQ